jgi:hypothetical protein
MSSSASGNCRQMQHAVQIHELGDRDPSPPHQRPSTPTNDTDTAKSILSSIPEKTIEEACKYLGRNFRPDDDDNVIEENLDFARFLVDKFLSQAWDSKPKLKRCIRNKYEFNVYVESDGKKQELVNVLKSMAKEEVP